MARFILNGKVWAAFHVADGTEVSIGDSIADRRGDLWTFESITRGTDYNGTAKIIVSQDDTDPDGEYASTSREFYAFRSIDVREV